MTAQFNYGMPPGGPNYPLPVPRIITPGGLLLTQISGGAIDISNGTDGSDIISNIKVATYSTEDLLNSESVTWATSDTVFARLISRKINKWAGLHHYWSTCATDHVYIWPQDGTASDSGAITTTDVSFTSAIANMNSEQAFAAAVQWDSSNDGVDAFPDTKMYQVDFDMSYLRSLDSDWTLTSALAVELKLVAEDQTLNWFIGARGKGVIAAAANELIDVLAVAQGHTRLFLQSAAAQNPTYRVRAW